MERNRIEFYELQAETVYERYTATERWKDFFQSREKINTLPERNISGIG